MPIGLPSVHWRRRRSTWARPRGSEMTAAAAGAIGAYDETEWRCCVLWLHMGDYFRHDPVQREFVRTPLIFHVKLVPKDEEGNLTVPGFK